jgi:class 3 adenylate cyclase
MATTGTPFLNPSAAARDLIFISYSHRDRDWLEHLRVFLKPYTRQNLQIWADPYIEVGQWRRDISTALLPEPSAERRQLTVLFADLVGSTALSQTLDAEDLRDVLRGYRDAVTAPMRDAGGFVAKFLGDGVLVYFGYPQASEDAAERAVKAGCIFSEALTHVLT